MGVVHCDRLVQVVSGDGVRVALEAVVLAVRLLPADVKAPKKYKERGVNCRQCLIHTSLFDVLHNPRGRLESEYRYLISQHGF
jgi:hypothetical protein